ncbi:hypothetical protein HZH68_016248 [Vespula germanica]|uniref:Uncharacterized protein n=1 Tax=Vespula germanica TaxID=30212 RepID=A0A834J1C5_VESGE|nr:hypothetical protein HZH68_016248 [Vespula germanica]
MVNQLMMRLSNVTEFPNRNLVATEVLLLMRGTLVLLTVTIPKNLALHVTRHLICQILKAAQEADAAHEFITNLANDGKPKQLNYRANLQLSTLSEDRKTNEKIFPLLSR